MNTNKSKILLPLLALIIWIVLISLFGLISHFSLAGFCLLVYGVSLFLYDTLNDRNSKKYNIQMIAGIIGLTFSVVNLINSFYLEGQGLLFKLFVSVFSLTCAYVFLKLSKEAIKKKNYKEKTSA